MRELIGRLNVSDDAAARALRVIDHFDRLIEEKVSAAALLRTTAALAGCPAGLHNAARGVTRRCDALLLIAPSLLVFIIFQRHFVKALFQGAVK